MQRWLIFTVCPVPITISENQNSGQQQGGNSGITNRQCLSAMCRGQTNSPTSWKLNSTLPSLWKYPTERAILEKSGLAIEEYDNPVRALFLCGGWTTGSYMRRVKDNFRILESSGNFPVMQDATPSWQLFLSIVASIGYEHSQWYTIVNTTHTHIQNCFKTWTIHVHSNCE
jgi:hypothetical protein